jgi:glycosyltransferase involved in cell wall biosynthesis
LLSKGVPDRIFIVADFGASLIHTHHGDAISAFLDLLTQNHQKFLVLLPMGSLLEIDERAQNYEVKKVLLPSSHNAPYRLSSVNSLLPVIFTNVSRIANRLSVKFVLRILIRFALLRLRKEISTQQKNFSQVCVLFPTACPFVIKFIEDSTSHLPGHSIGQIANVYARFTNTSENRGSFATVAGRNTLASSLAKNTDGESNFIRLGFETDNYSRSFEAPSWIKYRSPFPPLSQMPSSLLKKDQLTFSFLGYPKEIKGMYKILDIVRQVELHNSTNDLRWIIHIASTNDRIYSELNHLGNIKFLEGKISTQEMEAALISSSVLVLPYDVEKYSMNASAMAYRAADSEIPVLTFFGSAFSDDIKKYGLGWLAIDDRELINFISILTLKDVESCKKNLRLYNKVRTDENLQFLGLEEN